MRFHLLNTLACVPLVTVWLVSSPALRADDWLTWPSTYTHSPETGLRVDQYAVGQQPLAPNRSDFMRSGYRHFRSTLQAGQSADNLHVVEQWGRPVVPYEQWRFPFRPYGVPYDAWGPQAPYGIVNSYLGFGGNPSFGGGGYGPGGSGNWGADRGGPGWGMPPGGPADGTGSPNPGSPNPGWPSPAPDWQHPARPWPDYPGSGSPRPWEQPPSRGFPLTPTYRGEPWYDGGYPMAPPLGQESR